jgi:plastocyanin
MKSIYKKYLLITFVVLVIAIPLGILQITKLGDQNAQMSTANTEEVNNEQHESYEEPAPEYDTNWIKVTDSGFVPENATIGVNSNVVWVNKTSTPYAIVADDKRFELPEIELNEQSYSVTFSTPGTFHYHTTSSPQLNGTITVIK